MVFFCKKYVAKNLYCFLKLFVTNAILVHLNIFTNLCIFGGCRSKFSVSHSSYDISKTKQAISNFRSALMFRQRLRCCRNVGRVFRNIHMLFRSSSGGFQIQAGLVQGQGQVGRGFRNTLLLILALG